MKEPLPTDRHVTYLFQRRRCGRADCRCALGEQHGPYWYAYFRDDTGKLRSRYVGKHRTGQEVGA